MSIFTPREDRKIICCGSAPKTRLSKNIKLCVWNMQKCKSKNWAETFLRAAKKCDLFLGQEIKLTPKVKTSLEKNKMFWLLAVSFLSLAKRYPVGVCIGAKAKPLEVKFERAPKEPLVNIPKMAQAALYSMGFGQLLVINLHVVNFKGIKAFEQNLEVALRLFSEIKTPCIIAGDFNTWSKKRLNALKNFANSLGLSEVKFEQDTRSKYLRKPVDYIFVKGLAVKKSYVLKTDASDHNILFAELELIS